MQEVWVIKNKETGEAWSTRKGKTSWSKKGPAKNAWANAYNYQHQTLSQRFDDQDQYELVQVGDLTDWKTKYLDLVTWIEGVKVCDKDFSLGCGLEDNTITCRYEAADYGWDQCIKAISEGIEEE